MKNINQAKNLKGKKILLRLDLNVPVQSGEVLDDFRIKKILPTIDFLKNEGAKITILAHIGREKTNTLKPIYNYLKNIYSDLTFVKNYLEPGVPNGGDFVMFENLRQYDGEINNDKGFAKQIASFGDIYVNEAFSISHREHASIVSIPRFLESYSGILFDKEIKNLSQAFVPNKPSLFILGGNKMETKLPLIEKTVGIFDFVFIGGALANDFFKAKNLNVGKSLVSNSRIDFNLEDLLKNEKLILPVDIVIQNRNQKKPDEVLDDEKILDIGEESIAKLKKIIKKSNFILFNGPLGDYKNGFDISTKEIIKAVAHSEAQTIIGGGDTVLFVNKENLEDKFNFVSTGGGAMLAFLENKTLPGIEALE